MMSGSILARDLTTGGVMTYQRTPGSAAGAVPGPQGPPGPAWGITYTQATPLATWTIPNTLGRMPHVSVYVNGFQVDTDVEATIPQVVITFPTPAVGVAVLS